MNIGIVTMWFERGAAYVSRQYRQVLAQNHDVFIYARVGEYRQGDPIWDDEKVTWGKPSYLPVPTAIDRQDFESWIKQKKIDIVFFNEQQWWEPLSWCLELGVKTGAYIDYYTEETIPFFSVYDFLICNTQRHYAAFDWHPQAFYVPWGTDINLFKPQSFEPVNSDKVTFFHSCGYDPKRKGTNFIIQAFKDMSRSAKLIVHSQVDLIKAFPEHQQIIEDLESKGLLEYVRKTVPAPGLYHLGDIFVNASLLEGIGLPLIESQACGLPLITCNHPPMNEFIIPETGKGIEIDRLWSRNDGYYWPQCSPNIQNFTEILDDYAGQIANIRNLKATTRSCAEQKFNWLDRADAINSIFEKASIDTTRKQETIDKAIGFEKNRQGVAYRFANSYPWAWNLYSKWRYGN
ncbi:glycosyltransferase [Chamaesiphon polymorphus]|uniref:Glycosyl transferase n=1 Tax=Chamaesiphon polymorphus CCALA 037 TaxID=2107692 RepID=A0A2T1GMD7_9CYAN|nr:glycosyltransferase [Chamaesiphon polymorphus]PSB59039.1 glycosyl transferase [Chamaesiphon polymorphus CCALA 037]